MNPRNLLKFTRRSSLKSGNVMLGHYKLDNSFPILVKDAIACPRFFLFITDLVKEIQTTKY